MSYLNDMPYWWTFSKPFFHTNVTSHAWVAERRHERKAETALPPTVCSHRQQCVAVPFVMALVCRRASALSRRGARSYLVTSAVEGVCGTHLTESAVAVSTEALWVAVLQSAPDSPGRAMVL